MDGFETLLVSACFFGGMALALLLHVSYGDDDE